MVCMWLCKGCYCDGGEYDGVDDTHDKTYITTETVDSVRFRLENICVRFKVCLLYLLLAFVIASTYVLCEYHSGVSRKT